MRDIDKQIFISFSYKDENSSENMICPLCKCSSEPGFVEEGYTTTPMFWCLNEDCYYTVYKELDINDDRIYLKSLYIHNAVDSVTLDNAWVYYSKNNKSLPYLSEEDRELWSTKRDLFGVVNNYPYYLDDARMKDFLSLAIKNVGFKINRWYLSKNVNHDGCYALVQTSNNENTLFEERENHFLWDD